MGVTGRRGKLFVLVSSAINNADNNKAVVRVWAETALELVAVAINFDSYGSCSKYSRAETTRRMVAYHGVP